jgi:hypothetical protein
MGIKDLPCNPILYMTLSTIKAASGQITAILKHRKQEEKDEMLGMNENTDPTPPIIPSPTNDASQSG